MTITFDFEMHNLGPGEAPEVEISDVWLEGRKVTSLSMYLLDIPLHLGRAVPIILKLAAQQDK